MVKSFLSYIKEANDYVIYRVGDNVQCYGEMDSINFNGEIGTIIEDAGQNCLIRFPTRFNSNLHNGNGKDPSNSSYYVRKNLLRLINDDKIRIFLSNELVGLLKKMKDCKLAELYLSLLNGVDKEYVKDDYVDFLDIENDKTISFLKKKWWAEEAAKMFSKRRDKQRINRVIKLILKDDYVDSIIKQTDVELFMNTLNAIFKPCEVLELRGEDMLRAFNFTNELDLRKFSASCANYTGGKKNTENFKIYTDNPKNMAAIVTYEFGKITGRRTIQQGPVTRSPNEEDIGKIYTFIGNFYGENGGGSKYDLAILKYIKEKYPFSGMSTEKRGITILIENTRFPHYPPFDDMRVNFKTNEMGCVGGEEWRDAYGARCPEKYLTNKDVSKDYGETVYVYDDDDDDDGYYDGDDDYVDDDDY